MTVRIKRIYEPPAAEDGCRILVDRIWPRGIRRADARVDEWLKEIAPSTQLRRWFGHDESRWPEFCRLYHGELAGKNALVAALRERECKGVVTLLFAARDAERNNAAALLEYLQQQEDRQTTS
jgi:uncharacterized protein YeaO (DUF488 family)